MRELLVRVGRFTLFCHRWLGVALCVLFLMWFSSGIVMMYWDFPGVTAQDRLDRSPALEASAIRLSPAEAYARLNIAQPPAQVRLNVFDGRPVYRFRSGREEKVVYADTGEEHTQVSSETIQRIATAWTGQSAATAKVESVKKTDQWTVPGPLRSLRPLWKYSWPDGEQLYISGLTGDVVQYTTTKSRFWAWLGAIPHWLYFTPLRTHQPQWSQVVIWSSGTGAVTGILGIAIGIWMYSPRRQYRHAGVSTSIPYRGQKRWHMILGLVFGIAAVTWAFSGMLSMDPFPMTGGSARERAAGIAIALRGRFQIAAFEARHPRDAIAAISDLKTKELELTSVAGEPVYLAAIARGETRIVPVHGRPLHEFGADRVVQVVRQAIGPGNVAGVRVIGGYDAYYLDRRHQRPLPVVLIQLNDADHTRYYIDPKTARVVGSYSSRSWIARWLYHGLHSLDFPWLYKYRPLWDIVVIVFMAGGTALCVTSLLLAWRVVMRKFRGFPVKT